MGMMARNIPLAAFLTVLSLLTTLSCSSLGGNEPRLRNVDRSGLALHGYDPVSYFPEGGAIPKKGNPSRVSEYLGATYRFADADNQERFEADPQRYAPAYGGWCAWAMVTGERVDVDPRSFLIENDRLLLFYDGLFADTRERWLKSSNLTLGSDADSQWDRLQEVSASN